MFTNSYHAFLGPCQYTKQYSHQNFHEMKTMFAKKYDIVLSKICMKYPSVEESLNKVNAN